MGFITKTVSKGLITGIGGALKAGGMIYKPIDTRDEFQKVMDKWEAKNENKHHKK